MKKIILISIILLISILSYSQIIEELGTWEYGPTEAIAVKDSTAYISRRRKMGTVVENVEKL